MPPPLNNTIEPPNLIITRADILYLHDITFTDEELRGGLINTHTINMIRCCDLLPSCKNRIEKQPSSASSWKMLRKCDEIAKVPCGCCPDMLDPN